MSENKTEFVRDSGMDAMIEDLIDIFVNVEGVKLVRLSGMTIRARKISGKSDIPKEAIDGIIRKLNNSNVIKVHYITKCQDCGETSYQVIYDGVSDIGLKLCDSCSVLFQPINGVSLEKL